MYKSVVRPDFCPGCGSSNIEKTRPAGPAEWQCAACGELIDRIGFVRPAARVGNEQRYFVKPDQCPDCASPRLAMIIYGIPDFETEHLWNRMEHGEIILAGNYTGEDYPLWQCLECEAHFYSVTFP